LLLVLASCEAHIIGGAPSGTLDAAAGDAAGDAVALGPWSPPAVVLPAATTALEDDVTLSSNALELIFAIEGIDGGKDLYYTSRASSSTSWTTPAVLLPLSDAATSEETPRFSLDDKTLYFATDRAGNGNLDIWGVTRSAPGSADWGTPRPLGGISTPELEEKWFIPCNDDYFVMVQIGNNATDLLEGKLGGGTPKPIDALNTDNEETGAFVTRDCLTLYFASSRVSPQRIYISRRATVDAPWQPPTEMTDFEGLGGDQSDPWLSADGRTFAFTRDRDIYLSTRQ
jgi:hypothetical protein